MHQGDTAPSTLERDRLRRALARELPEIPAAYLYDDRGSELFERITRLPSYYPTRTEIGLLERHARAIVDRCRPREIVELGSGSSGKIGLVLGACRAAGHAVRRCTLVDVNACASARAAGAIADAHRGLEVRTLRGDFTGDLGALGPGGARLVALFGGTIGNLHPHERHAFLEGLARRMEPSDALLLGVDLVKDAAVLVAAYDDPEGVTEAFEKNALRVVNARFGADFQPDAFAYAAYWDPREERVDMRLAALEPMRVRVPRLESSFTLARGDEIRTEVSAKFTRGSLAAAAADAGLEVDAFFADPGELFGLALLRCRRP
jgi:L-histidine N-alpha-methyltransferase